MKYIILCSLAAVVVSACDDPTNPDASGFGPGAAGSTDSTCVEYVANRPAVCTSYVNWPYACDEFARQIEDLVTATAGAGTDSLGRRTERVDTCPAGATGCCRFSMLGSSGTILGYGSTDPCDATPSVGGVERSVCSVP